MWEKLVNCIKGGAVGKKKGCQVLPLSSLKDRVPPNQEKQFKMFAQKHKEYKARVSKYPSSLPSIDWAYYRQNVRPEYVDWVKRYEVRYDKLHSLFENRHAIMDHKRYFDVVDAESKVVRQEIKAYKAESNERIRKLTEKLEFMKSLKPYDQMTMEEFCFAKPHLAPDFINKPTFWPHTPEEQMPGPSDPEAAAALHEDPEPEEPEPTKKTPAAPEKPAAVVAAPKKDTEPTGSDLAEKATTLAKDLLAKTTVMFYTLKEKLSGMAKNIQKKAEEAKAAREEKADESSDPSAPSDPAGPLSRETRNALDCFEEERDSDCNVCKQTIIRCEEEEPNPEIKAQHGGPCFDPCEEDDERLRQTTRDLERRRQKEEQREAAMSSICEEVCDPCEAKDEEFVCEAESDPCQSQEEESDPCEPKVCEEVCDPCEDKEKELVCEAESDPCESKEDSYEEDFVCESEPDPCKPKKEESICESEQEEDESSEAEKEDHDSKDKATEDAFSDSAEPKESEQVFISIAKCSEEVHKKNEEKEAGDKPKESASLAQKLDSKEQKLIMGLPVTEFKDPQSTTKTLIPGAAEVGPVYKDPKQIAQLLTKEKEAKELKPVDDKPITIYPRREISAKPKAQKPEESKPSTEVLAKEVYSKATGAASLLSEATNTLEDLKKMKEERLEVLEQAYISAQRQAMCALDEASKAVNAANTLAQRCRESPDKVSSQDCQALALAEKHAALAKMMASRAVALKDDIARVLNDLKKKK